MTEEQKKKLEQRLWDIANTLRGKMDADEFRDYILGFIFYKYLSEKMHRYANGVLEQDGVTYLDVQEGTPEGDAMLEAVREDAVEQLGYFLKPTELFSEVARRGAGKGDEGASTFILGDLQAILNGIETSTMGTDSEEDFDKLFEDLDLTSSKLGRTEAAKNELISKILAHLNGIDFELEKTDSDVLGDAYEYLIGQFASGAGKKAGEFYTPREVSTVLARIVTTGKKRLKSVYDPTCGSGSLLLRVAREVDEVGHYYGQEMNRTTYNLARMNMLLHDIHYSSFNLRQEDTLTHPLHDLDLRFEAVVANPPFSAKWNANDAFLADDRFSQYGRLAPASKADFAFVQHMIHHLDESGTMAVILPHGVLFRGGAEGHIREFLIKDKNYLDAVIGLPANIFYGTSIPTCILVFKKCREHPDNVLFIDASSHFEKRKNQNVLRKEDIERIVRAYRERSSSEKFSYRAPMTEIAESGFNLNIPRYVNTFEEEAPIDLEAVVSELNAINGGMAKIDQKIAQFCAELGVGVPVGPNAPLLQAYKKGILQRIFAQTIRFRKDDGTAFPAWKEQKLKEVLTEHGERSTGKERVHSVSVHKGVIDQVEHLGRSFAAADTDHYNLVRPGDVIYTKSPTGDFPFGIIRQSKIAKNAIVSPLYGVFTPSSHHLGHILDEYFTSSINTHNYLHQIVQKGAKNTINITNAGFLEGALTLPVHVDEQKKIADFLAALDAKIESVSGLPGASARLTAPARPQDQD